VIGRIRGDLLHEIVRHAACEEARNSTREARTMKDALNDRSRWVKVCLAVTALFGTACDQDAEKNETPGELGKGVFRYLCVDTEDEACGGAEIASEFPNSVATNSSFDLAYDPFDTQSVGSAFVIEPVAEKFASPTGDGFRAHTAGTTAFLARQTSDGALVDFVHLRISNVSSLEVVDADGSALATTLNVGEEHSLQVSALDADDSVLAGASSYAWTTSDPGVLSLGLVSDGREMEIGAVAPGTAELSVETSGVAKTISFTVKP
jgi:hypothetical protein